MSVDLEKVIQMHNDGVQFTTQIMDDAAIHGRLDVVKWLHENRTEGCTKVAMNHAACGGFIDIVKWLHENRTEGCTTGAMDLAAANGYLNIVKWLHENRTKVAPFCNESCSMWWFY